MSINESTWHTPRLQNRPPIVSAQIDADYLSGGR